jgi:hypothetical protein
LLINLTAGPVSAQYQSLFYFKYGAGAVKMCLPLVVLQQSNSLCLAQFAPTRADSEPPSPVEAAWIAALGERRKEIPEFNLAQLNASKMAGLVVPSEAGFSPKDNLSLTNTLQEGWQLSLKPPPGSTNSRGGEPDFGPFYLSRPPQDGRPRIYLKVPDHTIVKALFPNLQAVDRYFEDTSAVTYGLDEALLTRCAVPEKKSYAIIRCSDFPTEYILAYPEPLVDKVSASSRLRINASRFNAEDAPSMNFSVQAAFGDAGGSAAFVDVNIGDFERLASISLDARDPKQVIRDNRLAWTGSLKYSLVTHAVLGDAESPSYFAFEVANAAQQTYLGAATNLPIGEVTRWGANQSVPWVRLSGLPRKFTAKPGSENILVKRRRYPSVIEPSFYKATPQGSTMSRFILVDDPANDTPFYVQEFEITVAEWRLFLQSEEAKPLLTFNNEAERKAFLLTTGESLKDYLDKPEGSQLRTYAIIAAIRSHLAATNSNAFVLDSFEVRLAENLDKQPEGFPMPLISKEAARHYASWVSLDAALPTTNQVKVLESLQRQPGIPGPVTSLDDFVLRQIDFAQCRGGKVFALDGNLAEVVLDSAEGRHGKFPWYGGEWGEHFPSPSSERTAHYTTGARLVATPP